MMFVKKFEMDANFELLQATPNYLLFWKMIQFTDCSMTRSLQSMFTQSYIKTNINLCIDPNIFDCVLEDTIVHNKRRPKIFRKGESLFSMNANQFMPEKISVEPGKNSIGIRILAHRQLSMLKSNLSVKNYTKRFSESDNEIINEGEPKSANGNQIEVTNLNNDLLWKKKNIKKYFETVMIHYHGGAFISMSSDSHSGYLIDFSRQLDIPVFSIDYRLAPQAQYPDLINDGITGYIWVVTFIEQVLKVPIKRLILTGDSAGGMIALSITNWCIENNFRKPDFLFPHYPCCNTLRNFQVTQSAMFAMENPMLNYPLLELTQKLFQPDEYLIDKDSEGNIYNDYYIDPIYTPDWILEQYPEIKIITNDYDPMKDDGFIFALKLAKAKNITKKFLTYARYCVHGCLSLASRFGLKTANSYLTYTIQVMIKYLSNSKNLLEQETESQSNL